MLRTSLFAGAALAGLVASHTSAHAGACDSNVIIVLDRSCSMTGSPAGTPDTKWEIAEAAIGTLTTSYDGLLRFGLIMFPDEDGERCDQDGPIYVETGEDKEQAVRDAIAATNPNGPCVTNIDTALGQVSADPAFGSSMPDGRRGFVLLLTDGKQSGSCGGADGDIVSIENIETMYAAGYPTYVVGFGGGVDPDDLNAFAVAGGVPRAGDPMYYQADDAVALDEALDAIAGDIVGDPEIGGCVGTPCPDNRCYGDLETCEDGVCRVHLPDAGPVTDAASAGPDAGGLDASADGSGAAGDDDSGCGCRTADAPAGTWLGLLLVGLLLRRRRR